MDVKKITVIDENPRNKNIGIRIPHYTLEIETECGEVFHLISPLVIVTPPKERDADDR